MPLKTQLDELPTLNMTPMIDIVFLLIIFFMVGTKFTEMERTIELNIPKVKSLGALTSAPEKKIINIYNDGTVTMDKTEWTPNELQNALSQAIAEYPDLGVIIRGDAQGQLQDVATVLTACKEAGINDMGISVRLDR